MTIGPYQIEGVLRKGPRPLYRARAADGRVLALKTMATAGITAEERQRFQREAAICKTLDHPNVVRVYDAGEADGVLYQAMDLLEGADLSQALAERRPLSWEEKLSIMEQVCEGLAYSHGRSLVHRDIKPANLFVEKSGRVRILDFGMARVEASTLTKVGSAVGTITYMAPEQIRGETCTAASDVFAAGVVFYELATGKHPFAGGETDLSKILTAIMFQAPAPLKAEAPDAPDGLDLVLNKALEKNAKARVQNAGDLKQALALCRITLKLRPAAGAGAKAQESDPGKTIVMPGAAQIAAAARKAPAPPPPVAGPEPPAPPRPAPSPEFRYCSSCTHANPKDAQVCARCGLPLTAQRAPTAEAGSPVFPLQWAVAAAVALGILLLLWLILR